MIVSRFQTLVERTTYVRARPFLAYALAIVLVCVALAIRLLIGDILPGYPFLTIFPAVTIAVFAGGLGPGIAAAIFGAVLSDYFLIPPYGFTFVWPTVWVAMLFYAITVTIIISLTTGMLTALERLKASETVLELRVNERTQALTQEIAERSKAETMLRHMHKMDAVGQLTGGVAHDFNNLLSVIIGSAERAKRRLAGPEHPQIASGLDAILEGAHRAATLVSRLLAFSRQQPLQPENLDINDLILGMSDMLHRTLGENIRVETELAGNLWPCVADRSELENAILNLAVNARDAMPGGGKLIVETANAALDERYAAAHTDVRPGQYVMISVCDTGSALSHAMEPFFTTKGVGKGTGLGLSQVFGYARQSGGHVKIYSEVGHGTVVKLYLPRLALSAAQPPTEVRGTAREIAAGSKDTVILIVEDDPQVRATSVASVLELGYGVLEASGPKDALQILQREKISLLFTDVIMPEMSGRQLAEQAKASNPDLRVLYTTGYSRNAIVHNGALDPGIMLLPKPYTLAQLAAKLTEALA